MTRVVSIAMAAVLAASGAAPSIRFDHATHDFGAIPSNQKRDVSRAYHNDGTANPKMPGFSSLMGGPLDEAQVASLVKLLRSPPPGKR